MTGGQGVDAKGDVNCLLIKEDGKAEAKNCQSENFPVVCQCGGAGGGT